MLPASLRTKQNAYDALKFCLGRQLGFWNRTIVLFLCSSINCMCFHFRSKEPGKDWREQLLCDPVNTSLHPSE